MIELTINGKKQTYDGEGDRPPSWNFCDFAGLTGRRFRELPLGPRLNLGG